jgi:hypothetical protein
MIHQLTTCEEYVSLEIAESSASFQAIFDGRVRIGIVLSVMHKWGGQSARAGCIIGTTDEALFHVSKIWRSSSGACLCRVRIAEGQIGLYDDAVWDEGAPFNAKCRSKEAARRYITIRVERLSAVQIAFCVEALVRGSRLCVLVPHILVQRNFSLWGTPVDTFEHQLHHHDHAQSTRLRGSSPPMPLLADQNPS